MSFLEWLNILRLLIIVITIHGEIELLSPKVCVGPLTYIRL